MLGLVVGLGLALWVILESPVLVIDQDRISVRRRGQVERVLERSKIDSIYRSGSKTVIETETGRKLFEDEIEGDRSEIRAAFVDKGYPWEGAPD